MKDDESHMNMRLTPDGITRRNVLKLAAGACIALGALPSNAAAEENGASEEALIPNSWRYDDGVLRTDLEPEGISLYGNFTPWGRDEGGNWCNSVGTPIPGALLRGVDVSEWQGDIDWDTVKSSGDIDFAIIRAAAFEGSTNTRDGKDLKWDRNAAACERLGIPYGAYIYSYATTVEGARREAEYILGLLEGHVPTYPIFIDMEDISTLEASVDLNQIASAFCERVEAAGYRAGIYSNLNWWTNYITSSTLDKWVRWVAQYNITCDYKGRYEMWQASSAASVAGISGNVDINFDFVGLALNDGTLYRLYNPNSGEHFYTSSAFERSHLIGAGWRSEGIGWTAPESSSSPVYRLYNPNAGDHHYTMSAYERDSLVKVGWRYEGIGWYSDDAKAVPLYRLYNPNARAGAHHYTASAYERDSLVRAGWRDEGIGWYGVLN